MILNTFTKLLSLALIATITAQTFPGKTIDPARVKVVENRADDGSMLKVLQTADRRPLRGPTIWQWKSCPENDSNPDRNPQLSNQSLFNEFRDVGMTVVRLCSFEVWFQSDNQPHAEWSWTDFSNPNEVVGMMETIEKAVDAAAAAGLYIIINAHNKFITYDHQYTMAFWEAVAPHFAKRSHVIYEPVNEVKTGPSDYTDEDIKNHVELCRRIRELAPDTFQVVLTPSGTWGPSNPDGSGLNYNAMLDLAERFDKEWSSQGGTCDWTLTATGYHLYFNGKTSVILKNLHKRYPGLPAEFCCPNGIEGFVVIKPDDAEHSEAIDGIRFMIEVCEKLHPGWQRWHERLWKSGGITFSSSLKTPKRTATTGIKAVLRMI